MRSKTALGMSPSAVDCCASRNRAAGSSRCVAELEGAARPYGASIRRIDVKDLNAILTGLEGNAKGPEEVCTAEKEHVVLSKGTCGIQRDTRGSVDSRMNRTESSRTLKVKTARSL